MMNRGIRGAACSRGGNRLGASAVVALFLVLATAGATIAYLVTNTNSLTNTFLPSEVACVVTEDFDGMTKTNVNVQNTGDTAAFVRVKLVSYRVNDAGERIGGVANIPMFTPGAGWFAQDGYYYYALPVQPGMEPAVPLADSMILVGAFTDADGGKQVLEVLAEAIQSVPDAAVEQAWGVTVSGGSLVQAEL